MKFNIGNGIVAVTIMTLATSGCQKTGSVPFSYGAASLTVVNATPTVAPVLPIFNTGGIIQYYSLLTPIGYGAFREYFPDANVDTFYITQDNADTANVGSKTGGPLLSGVLNLKPGNVYSLFLTGADTNAPEYFLTTDTIPSYAAGDSSMGVRFVNLSEDSQPFAINLAGNNTGSEAPLLVYKGITSFKSYACNSTKPGYQFIIRDAATGDSLLQYTLNQNYGYGLVDPNNNRLLVYKNVTIAIYGSENGSNGVPLKVMLIENF